MAVAGDGFGKEPLPLEPQLTDLVVEKYEGERDEQQRLHGTGNITFRQGSSYEGEVHRGMLHGTGTYTWKSGITFQGSFHYNEVHGSGVFSWPDGSAYDGEVAHGLRHGKGVFTTAEGQQYDGQWVEGVREGRGVLSFNIMRSVVYTGEWRANTRHGQGKMSYATGNVYEGGWKDNLKHGQGIMEWHEGRPERYVGEWSGDLQNGYGEHVWMDKPPASGEAQKQMCNVYRGHWKDGKRHGHGSFFYANGSQYSGQWKENCKDGYGVFIFEDGRVYEGLFNNDRIVHRENIVTQQGEIRPQFRLQLQDLLVDRAIGTQALQEETERLEKLLLRATSELKVVYTTYARRALGADTVADASPKAKTALKRGMSGGPSRLGAEDSGSGATGGATEESVGGSGAGSGQTRVGLGTRGRDNMFAMTLGTFWCFVREAGLIGPTLSVHEVNVAYESMTRHHQQQILSAVYARTRAAKEDREDGGGTGLPPNQVPEEAAFVDPAVENATTARHDPSKPLLLREFGELVVRCAALSNYASGEVSAVYGATSRLLEEHVKPICRNELTVDPFWAAYYSAPVQHMLDGASAELSACFVRLCDNHAGASAGAGAADTQAEGDQYGQAQGPEDTAVVVLTNELVKVTGNLRQALSKSCPLISVLRWLMESRQAIRPLADVERDTGSLLKLLDRFRPLQNAFATDEAAATQEVLVYDPSALLGQVTLDEFLVVCCRLMLDDEWWRLGGSLATATTSSAVAGADDADSGNGATETNEEPTEDAGDSRSGEHDGGSGDKAAPGANAEAGQTEEEEGDGGVAEQKASSEANSIPGPPARGADMSDADFLAVRLQHALREGLFA